MKRINRLLVHSRGTPPGSPIVKGSRLRGVKKKKHGVYYVQVNIWNLFLENPHGADRELYQLAGGITVSAAISLEEGELEERSTPSTPTADEEINHSGMETLRTTAKEDVVRGFL